MKKLLLSLFILLNLNSSFSQKHSFSYKKNIVAGAVMTGVGGVTLPTGAALVAIGASLNNTPGTYTYNAQGQYTTLTEVEDGTSYLIAGSVLMAVGAAMVIAGPILLVRGIKQKRSSAYLDFSPIKPMFCDRFTASTRQQKLATLTITF